MEKEGNFPAICLAGCLQGSHLAGTKGSRLLGQLQAGKNGNQGGSELDIPAKSHHLCMLVGFYQMCELWQGDLPSALVLEEQKERRLELGWLRKMGSYNNRDLWCLRSGGKRKLEHMYMQMIFLSHGSAVGLLWDTRGSCTTHVWRHTSCKAWANPALQRKAPKITASAVKWVWLLQIPSQGVKISP